MKVLIVEDNAQMRDLIKRFLRGLADDTAECGDGQLALAAYTQHLPDWLLMDLVSAEVDGLAVTKQIRAYYPEARIVILAHCDDSDLRAAAKAAGACGFVVQSDLSALRHVLSQSVEPDKQDQTSKK